MRVPLGGLLGPGISGLKILGFDRVNTCPWADGFEHSVNTASDYCKQILCPRGMGVKCFWALSLVWEVQNMSFLGSSLSCEKCRHSPHGAARATAEWKASARVWGHSRDMAELRLCRRLPVCGAGRLQFVSVFAQFTTEIISSRKDSSVCHQSENGEETGNKTSSISQSRTSHVLIIWHLFKRQNFLLIMLDMRQWCWTLNSCHLPALDEVTTMSSSVFILSLVNLSLEGVSSNKLLPTHFELTGLQEWGNKVIYDWRSWKITGKSHSIAERTRETQLGHHLALSQQICSVYRTHGAGWNAIS